MFTRRLALVVLLFAASAAAGFSLRSSIVADPKYRGLSTPLPSGRDDNRSGEHGVSPFQQNAADGVTTVSVGTQVLRTDVERFGINLSGQSFYDSGQMMRNLVARNPGFEGEIWQSILRCKVASASACTEENQYTQWPAGFLDGAHFEVLSGAAEGLEGAVLSSTAAAPPNGITLRFAALPRALHTGDFVLVRTDKPGDATAGWWTDAHGSAAFATETKDLPPHTAGRQAARVEAAGAGQSAELISYFDSLEGHSFVQMHGPYEIRFKAKPTGGAGNVSVSLTRLDTVHGRAEFFNKDVKLMPGWHEYSFAFTAHEDGSAVGTVGLHFAFSGASALLDDVSLASIAATAAPAFRSEVVEALRQLHPGLLRYMDSGAGFGSSLDNLLAPEFARQRSGYSTQELKREDIPIGLEDFLELCAVVGADPWITLPAGFAASEGARLVEFLAGAPGTTYGGRRAALGHAAPWTRSFRKIHVELGNEQWNSRSFAGATIHDPAAYAHRAGVLFGAMRRASAFAGGHFDLIAGTWNAVPWWTGQELASVPNADTLAVAPYLFSEFNDAKSEEAIYGPMLAQPEQLDSRAEGTVALQAAEMRTAERNAARGPRLAVYEVNLGTMSGSATQAQLDRVVPSWGGGLAVADHMLLMLRDQGITTQALFCLPEFRNFFTNTAGGGQETMSLWGAVVDMDGATNRKRPTYLALQAVNSAILQNMLQTTLSGANPTWDQPASTNDKVELRGAHELQVFAFGEGERRSLVLLNLSRARAHSVQLAAETAPLGPLEQTQIAPPHLSDGNELAEAVKTASTTLAAGRGKGPISLPAGSLTVLRWSVGPGSSGSRR